MAYDILSGKSLQAPSTGLGDETAAQVVSRNIERLPYRIAESAVSGFGLGDISSLFQALGKKAFEFLGIENLTPPRYLPTSGEAKEFISKPAEKLYKEPGYLTPKNKAEEAADLVYGNLPLLLSGGGNLLWNLGRDILGTGSMKGAEALGAHPLLSSAIGFGAGLGADIFKRKGFPTQIKKAAEHIMERDYKAAEPIAKTLTEDAKPLSQNLKTLLEEVYGPASGLEGATEKAVRHQINKATQNIKRNQINVHNAWRQKKHFNNLIKEQSNDIANAYYKRAVGAFNEVLKNASEKYPEFGVPFNRAEDYWKGLNIESALRHVLEETTSLKRLRKKPLGGILPTGIIGAGFLGGGPLGTAGAVGSTLAARQFLRNWDFFTQSKLGQKQLADIARLATYGDKSSQLQLISAIRNLDPMMNNYAQGKETGDYEVISGKQDY